MNTNKTLKLSYSDFSRAQRRTSTCTHQWWVEGGRGVPSHHQGLCRGVGRGVHSLRVESGVDPRVSSQQSGRPRGVLTRAYSLPRVWICQDRASVVTATCTPARGGAPRSSRTARAATTAASDVSGRGAAGRDQQLQQTSALWVKQLQRTLSLWVKQLQQTTSLWVKQLQQTSSSWVKQLQQTSSYE